MVRRSQQLQGGRIRSVTVKVRKRRTQTHLLWPPYVIGQAVIFCPVVSVYLTIFLSFFFFPRLISAAADWMSTILRHMVWP